MIYLFLFIFLLQIYYFQLGIIRSNKYKKVFGGYIYWNLIPYIHDDDYNAKLTKE
jgi:hypothetical protein